MNSLVIVRGGGDLATGIIQKLYRTGFKILVLETEMPLAIRRTVALCQAVYDGTSKVEDVTAKLITSTDEIDDLFIKGIVPVIIDPKGETIKKLKPIAVVDAIIAKRNLGTSKDLAPITIGLGPGFVAGQDVDIAIETMRGHDLGRLIFKGSPMENTGTPGIIAGKGKERVIHSPASGITKHVKKIGDIVSKDEIIFYADETPVKSPLDGLIRGLITENIYIKKGLKVSDVDPRTDVDINTISDKARSLGGAVLEGILLTAKEKGISFDI